MEVKNSSLLEVSAGLLNPTKDREVLNEESNKVTTFVRENKEKLSASDLMDFSSRLESRILEIEDDKTGIKGFFLNLFFPQKILDKDSEVKVLKEVRDRTAATFLNQMSSYTFKDVETGFLANRDNGIRLRNNCEDVSEYLIRNQAKVNVQELRTFHSHLGSRIKEIEDNTSGIKGFFHSLFTTEKIKDGEKAGKEALDKLQETVETKIIDIDRKEDEQIPDDIMSKINFDDDNGNVSNNNNSNNNNFR